MKKFLALLSVYFLLISNVFAQNLRFVQVTDVRYSKENNSTVLKNVIKDINRQKKVKFVVFTGDNLQRTNMQDLEDFIKAAKKLHKPFYVVLGDKDVNKYKGIGKKEYQAYLKKKLGSIKTTETNYIFEKNGVVFFVVDGTRDVIPGTNGYYKDDIVDWVDRNLDLYSKNNVIILQHFPLVPPEQNENYATFKAQKYLEVIEKHPNVKAVISGHFGINKEESVNNIIHISTAQTPCYRIIDLIDVKSPNMTIWAEVKEIK